jgi:hypothetical protein
MYCVIFDVIAKYFPICDKTIFQINFRSTNNTFLWIISNNLKVMIFSTLFTTKRITCPQVTINNMQIPVQTEVKYLGLYLDQKLTWQKHVKTKRQKLNLKLREMTWLLGRKSKLSMENKLLLYKCIMKPLWAYGIQLWGCTKPSN